MKQAFRQRARGFTLIELMIVVAIVGILAAFAYPSFVEFLKKGYRAEARAVLMEAAHTLQRSYSVKNTYAGVSLPASLTRSPENGTQRYTISITSQTVTEFQVQAVPNFADDCGTLTLTGEGKRGAAGVTTGEIVDRCWK